MGNRIDTRVILGSLRYKSAPDTSFFFQVPLQQSTKEITEYDRSVDLNLEQVYDDERQKSDVMRPTAKFSLIFKNSYSGQTNYPPFENYLYYVNAEAAANLACTSQNPQSVIWSGLPQYYEFDFIRNDYNVSGYTIPPNEHLIFQPKSASSYNWNFYMSYAYENDYNKKMYYKDKKTNLSSFWICGNGIPFVVSNNNNNGLGRISFRCPVKHGLSTGESVKLFDLGGIQIQYNNTTLFQVDSLGEETAGSEEYVFNIINVGYTGTTFANNTLGTFKRVILRDNESDSTSEYYVRRHKILTDSENAVMVKAGFEQNVFGIKKKFESSAYTPNQVSRISIKEGAQSYSLTFNEDVKVGNLLDNQKRPISELFFTVIVKGYFGWFFGRPNVSGGYYGLKEGWEFNLPLDPSTNNPQTWWKDTQSESDTNIPLQSYTTSQTNPPFAFTYISSLSSGDTLDGDYCEWNDYEQKERVISNLYHKFTFNPNSFTLLNVTPNNPPGYFYQPHHSLPTRVYSDYIEEGNKFEIVGVPDYAYYSTNRNQFIWRDLYQYGFIDSLGNGISFPFFNEAHYPFGNYVFRIIPEGTNYIEQIIIDDPTTDFCE